jgi:undecaprenyl-diphosphatase
MTLFESFVLGIVEGASEFLPISSTGHLILASTLLGIEHTEFVKTFEIVIQLGAMLAVVVLFLKSFFNLELLQKILVAFIPTGVVGLLLYPFLKSVLLGNTLVVVASLFVGGVVLIAFERWHIPSSENSAVQSITYPQAFWVGLFQAVAIIPGVSRSGATIIGGMLLGLSRSAIVEFSFLLAVPTILAASALSLLKVEVSFTGAEWIALAVGFTTSFAVAIAAIRWLLSYIRTHSFTSFGVYRIVLALVCAFFLL